MNKMIMFFLFSIWSMMLFLFFFLSINYLHPIMTMIILISLSITLNVNMSMWKSNFLYSIMLFLMMISGMLIIFLYFASLISNEQMKFSLNKFTFLSFLLNLLFFLFLSISNNSLSNNFSPHYFKEINPILKINEKHYQNILYIYEYPFNNFTISCMLYLLIALLIVIKICSMKILSLRKIK